MKNSIKKISCFFLAVLMSFGGITAFAEDEFPEYDFSGKNIAFYGDSIVAQTNGNWDSPYTFPNWATLVGKYFGFEKVYSRGIGGQTYRWNNDGGSVSFVDESTGEYKDRKDGISFDDYTGEIENGQIKTRGCASSYHRIASMFPESIRENIDYIFVIYHNDAGYGTALNTESAVWESGSSLDPEWYSSEYYAKFGGDYNINTTAGAIASTIMKLGAVLPNAKIILGTPISGRGPTGKLNPDMSDSSSAGMLALRNLVIKAAETFSVECVDVYGTCGINGINRTEYISDSIHPNRFGGEMLARGIIGGLKEILVPDSQKYDWKEKNIAVYSVSKNSEPFYTYDNIVSAFGECSYESIDGIVVSFESIQYYSGEFRWKTDNDDDNSWSKSGYYPDFLGDYDFSSTKGQIASLIMKLQAMFPNSVLIFDLQDLSETELFEPVIQTAMNFSIPCVNGFDSDNPEEYLHSIIPKFSKTSFGENISGVISFAHSTVSYSAQGIYGFEPGETYKYKITPDYSGKISMYYAFKNTSKATCFDIILNPMALSAVSCSENSSITGTFTIPDIDKTDDDPIKFIVIRSYTNEKISIYYEFTKISENSLLPDLNLDGSVDIKDVYTARLIAAKLLSPTEQQIALGDVDSDGKITAIDANIIRKFIAGIIKEIPVK